MIEIIATIESKEQAEQLLALDIDKLYFGEENYGLRLAHPFSLTELAELVTLAHQYGKKARVAVNAIMHPEDMQGIGDYLSFLQKIGVDEIVVGDPGVIYTLKRDEFHLPYVYDAATMVTSSRQINFWANRGAVGAVLAREIPFLELQELGEKVQVPTEYLVYGATCIHHSKRPLLENYFSFVRVDGSVEKERGLYISEPKDEETHYSIYEDKQGTHIFQTNDVNMMLELQELVEIGLTTWKLDGIYTPGEAYVEIVALFVQAKKLIEANEWNQEWAEKLNQEVLKWHPEERSLDQGFYYLDPKEIR